MATIIATLNRIAYNATGTLGILHVPGDKPFTCFTVENPKQPYKKPGLTRIPDGCYSLVLRTHGTKTQKYMERFGRQGQGIWALEEVPNFTDILFHPGNAMEDTDGCILPNHGAHIDKSIVLGRASSAATQNLNAALDYAAIHAAQVDPDGDLQILIRSAEEVPT